MLSRGDHITNLLVLWTANLFSFFYRALRLHIILTIHIQRNFFSLMSLLYTLWSKNILRFLIFNKILNKINGTFLSASELSTNNDFTQHCLTSKNHSHLVMMFSYHHGCKISFRGKLRIVELSEMLSHFYFVRLFYSQMFNSSLYLVRIYHLVFLSTCVCVLCLKTPSTKSCTYSHIFGTQYIYLYLYFIILYIYIYIYMYIYIFNII